MTATAWSGRAVMQAREVMRRTLPAPCARCGRELTDTDQWVIGHIKPRGAYPQLIMEPSNWQIECRPCSNASSQQAVQEKAAADALRSAGIDPETVNDADFSGDNGSAQSAVSVITSLWQLMV